MFFNCWLVACGALTAQSASPVHGEATQPQVLQIKLSIVQPELKEDSKDVFEVSVFNISDHAIWIYKNLSYGMEIWIKDSEGKDLTHSSTGPLCPPPPPDGEDFVQLLPGKTLVTRDDRSLRDLGVQRSGKYSAVASYYYRVVIEHGHKFLNLVDRPMSSIAIGFEVR